MKNEIMDNVIPMAEIGMSNWQEDRKPLINNKSKLPEILFIASYPPRECGIATYTQDLIKALTNKFEQTFKISICALESENEKHAYSEAIKYILDTDYPFAYIRLAKNINADTAIKMVLIQHEFGFFEKNVESFNQLLENITKPKVLVFHTVLPRPDDLLRTKVQNIAKSLDAIIVMTHTSADILVNEYGIETDKINVIPHGTHLVPLSDKELLKGKYHVADRIILSTFGLLSSGKSIETTLNALPAIIDKNPAVLFLIIGKTHPSVVKHEGEKYRQMLEHKVVELGLQNHVQFVNYFLPLSDLLEYLQLTDIYLFTSKDPNQAVSGTFSYAISCGCPIISTPIPHAKEVLSGDNGIIVDFENPQQLAKAINTLLNNEQLRTNISLRGLHLMASTAWENSAIAHALLFEKVMEKPIDLQYKLPVINLDHIKRLTTDFGMIQFSKISQPDIETGYTLDDNARAMVAMCQYYEITGDEKSIDYIRIYLDFIKFCLQSNGNFLNYVNEEKEFTEQNNETNLEDSNGRAIWALGYLLYCSDILPEDLLEDAEFTLQFAIINIHQLYSTRAMAFVIKGLYYHDAKKKTNQHQALITELANRLVQMFRHESDPTWQWYESYITYGNSILPEAMLCAWLATGGTESGDPVYKEIAKSTFDFLLSKVFTKGRIKVISNKTWLHKGNESVLSTIGGEQPIDVAYTIFALSKFYDVFQDEEYLRKTKVAFSWFLGANHLHQIIYNPCTGGCYDGLEESYVNLNQGAESTVSYLMARLTLEKYLYPVKAHQKEFHFAEILA